MIIWRGTISGSGVFGLLSPSTVIPRYRVVEKFTPPSEEMEPRKTFTMPLSTPTFSWRSLHSSVPPTAWS